MKKRNFLKKAITALIMVATLFSMVVLPFSHTATPITASAATAYTESKNDFDKTLVIDDLGEEYVAQFANASGGIPQLQSFMEYCYSKKPTVLNTKYGLYIYIYNPSRIEFSTGGNVANMATAYNAYGAPSAYSNLRLMNCGHTTGKYDKLFYKFRVLGLQNVLANAQACEAKSGYRRYDLVGIQLRKEGSTSATDYEIARTFTYSGYAEGCGAEGESTLVCKQSEMEVLNLEVHPTVYRPEGNNGTNEFTKDSLHSVWFAVPNEYINKYGEMSAIRATWLEAVLNPALVIGYQDAFNSIKSYLGKSGEDGYIEDLGYFCLGDYDWSVPAPEGSTAYAYCDYIYNAPEHWYVDDLGTKYWNYSIQQENTSTVNSLYLMFNAGEEENSADNYYVSSEVIKEAMLNAAFGGESVNGKYSSKIFSSYKKEFTVADISRDETRKLFSQTEIDQGFWGSLFGKEPEYESDGFENKKIYAIHKVVESDFSGKSSEDSSNLFINENDYDALVSDYNEAKNNNETIYLFRYATSEYFAQEATVFEKTDKGVWANDEYYWEELGSNAYFFTEKVFLDFEIIHVEFSKNEVKTIIPVVMSPIDVIPSSEPPIETTPDNPSWSFPDLGGFGNGVENFLNTLKKTIAAIVVVVVGSVVVVVIVKAVSKKKGQSVRIDVGTSSKNSKPKRKKRRK